MDIFRKLKLLFTNSLRFLAVVLSNAIEEMVISSISLFVLSTSVNFCNLLDLMLQSLIYT